ncbi:MAG: hypothetical protein WBP34_16815 [Thermoanaerobaculia bacterium]
MHGSTHLARRRIERFGIALSCLLVASFFAAVATAQPPEAQAVMDGMVDADIIKQVDYAFLAVDYDDSDNVLYFAARDGGHFDPTMDAIYSVPIASINVVDVTSNSDVTIKDGKQVEMGHGPDDASTGDFTRLSRGCTVHLVAKDPDFGWAKLVEGQVSDGKLTVDYEALDLQPTKTVDVGFFECDHARDLQAKFHKLHKQVKKGM